MGRPFSDMLDINRRLMKFINIWSSIDLTEQLGVSSGAAAAVTRVHLRSEITPWHPPFVHHIVMGKWHPGPCRTTVYVFAIHCRNTYHWLGLVRQFRMTSGSATRRFRAWHSFPERELLPFRPLLQPRRLDGKPPVQGLLEPDSRSCSRSSVHCSDADSDHPADPALRTARRALHTAGGPVPRCVPQTRPLAAQLCAKRLPARTFWRRRRATRGRPHPPRSACRDGVEIWHPSPPQAAPPAPRRAAISRRWGAAATAPAAFATADNGGL